MSHVWPEVIRDRPAYTRLSTDFWPWPEVLADLEARPALAASLELSQGALRGRVLWSNGAVLGAHANAADADFASLARALPRATVSLYLLEPIVAQLLWQCRDAEPQTADVEWESLRAGLSARAFTGVVRAISGDSYWEAGARVGGPEPLASERVALLAPSLAALSGADIVAFYNEALATAASVVPLDALWRASALELADDHMCLDPFAREIIYENGALTLGTNVPTDELLPALRDAFALTVEKSGRAPAELGLDRLRGRPLWTLSGLGGL